MIPLQTKGKTLNVTETLVGVFHRSLATGQAHVVTKENFQCTLHQVGSGFKPEDAPTVFDIGNFNHLDDGDIVSVNPNGLINTLFRVNSKHNALFITDRCNSNCLMCSQPPKNIDDLDYHYRVNNALINLIPKDTPVIGVTGGEPTLLGSRLIDLLELANIQLPDTAVHMLSNGRAFAWRSYASKFSSLREKVTVCIPLYADNYLDHDYVVQAKDAFNQTVVGIHNLARWDIMIEIRVVLHKLTYARLPELARFIYKNFPFVEHIALMGLEYIGYTPFNHDKLWIEPSQFMNELEEATLFLDQMGMNVSIYNLQHCLLRESLWRFSRKSISDWKRDYVEECTRCKKLDDCGGVFATSKMLSHEIKAIID